MQYMKSPIVTPDNSKTIVNLRNTSGLRSWVSIYYNQSQDPTELYRWFPDYKYVTSTLIKGISE
jgi:hypothetical protein